MLPQNPQQSAPNPNPQQPETRCCDLCSKLVSRIFLTKVPECEWDFPGTYAHLECYIDHQVKKKIGEVVPHLEAHAVGIMEHAYKKEKEKGFFKKLFS